MRTPHPSGAAIDYPSSDGRPMADNDWQLAAMLYAIGALQARYARRRDVYVSDDLLVYYEEGNPRASVAPDVFVVFGAEARKRIVYKLWESPWSEDLPPLSRKELQEWIPAYQGNDEKWFPWDWSACFTSSGRCDGARSSRS